MSYFSLFSYNYNYRMIYIGQFISYIGTMITNVALPYQIYHETQSTLLVGLLSGLQLFPLLGTVMFGGVLADRYQKRILLIIADSLFAICSFVLLLNALSVTPRIWLLFVVTPVMSAVSGLHRPALISITQQIISPKDFPTASVLKTFMKSICKIIGPVIGGLIIAYFGLFAAYLFDFISFVLSLLLVSWVKNLPVTNIEFSQSIWKDITQVLNYVFSRQELFGAYLIDFIAMATAIPTALFPAIAQNLGGVKVLGVLYSSFSIGAFIVAIFVTPWVNKIKRHGLVIVYAAAFWGIAILLFGLANNIYVAVFFLILAGCGDAISSIFRAIMYNEIVPNKLRGRLSGIEMIGYYSGPKLGDTKAGLITTAFGITTSIVSGGLLCVVCIIGCYYFLPKFVCYRSTH